VTAFLLDQGLARSAATPDLLAGRFRRAERPGSQSGKDAGHDIEKQDLHRQERCGQPGADGKAHGNANIGFF